MGIPSNPLKEHLYVYFSDLWGFLDFSLFKKAFSTKNCLAEKLQLLQYDSLIDSIWFTPFLNEDFYF